MNETCIDQCFSWVTGVSDETNIKGFNTPGTSGKLKLITVGEVYVYGCQATVMAC